MIQKADIVATNERESAVELVVEYSGGHTQRIGPTVMSSVEVGRLLHVAGTESFRALPDRPVRVLLDRRGDAKIVRHFLDDDEATF